MTPTLRVETKRKSKKKTAEVYHKKESSQGKNKMSFLIIVAIFIFAWQILDRDKD